ncbi:MAG: GntR family transcriptional regulator [Rheinheimera sp.]|nr:GntR family transcriptional regulator [Rheinheimera sp.]
MKNEPIQNLTHQLTHDLGLAIVQGVYPVGSGMPSEAELCIRHNVSRSATREAVKMLSAKGLLTSRPKQGIRVLPESNWNMFDTDVLRWILSSKPSLSLLLRIHSGSGCVGTASRSAGRDLPPSDSQSMTSKKH